MSKTEISEQENGDESLKSSIRTFNICFAEKELF
jgi:hypothetical protein